MFLGRALVRRLSSALYVTGDKAQNQFAVLTPHLDIEERFEDLPALERNVRLRGLDVDLEKVGSRWAFYANLVDKKRILSYTKEEMGKEISELMKEPEKYNEEIAKLKYQLHVVKDEYYVLSHYMYGVEESAAEHALSLPNVLHARTPEASEDVLHVHGERPTHESKSHLELGTEQSLLEYGDGSFVFLMNEAATVELALADYFRAGLMQHGFTQMSNADFAKSVIVEGCGGDPKHDVLTVSADDTSNNRLHLTGSGSHHAFMAYFSRYSVPKTQLPLKYFAVGRKYQPCRPAEPGLLNLLQHSTVQTFAATHENAADMDAAFDESATVLRQIYDGLGYHYRLVYLPANRLAKHESLRLSVQMYSNYKGEYVEVGNLSACDGYFSKRLLFTYSEEKTRKYPKVIVGDVLNVHKLLACLIENRNGDGLTCEVLKRHMPL